MRALALATERSGCSSLLPLLQAHDGAETALMRASILSPNSNEFSAVPVEFTGDARNFGSRCGT
jgi:hypothetical protein